MNENTDGGTRYRPLMNTIAGSNNGSMSSNEIKVDQENKTYVIPFVNEYGKTLRNLIVKKTVSGDTQYMDLSQKFKFTITLTDENNTGLTGTYGKVIYVNGVSSNSSVTFTDGTTTVDLGDKDYIQLTGLPIDTNYVVSENGLPTGYTFDAVNSDPMSGVLSENQTVNVINNFYFAPPTGAHLPKACGTAAAAGLIFLAGGALFVMDYRRRRAA